MPERNRISSCLPTRPILGAMLLALTAGNAAAQDYNLPASYGAVHLAAGFTIDPHYVSVQAGGGNARSCGNGSTFYFADAPDFELTYSAAGYPLTILAQGSGELALLINRPDRSMACVSTATPYVVGGKPFYHVENAPSGVYDIWVGAPSGAYPAAEIIISERGYQYFE